MSAAVALSAPFVIRGELVEGDTSRHRSRDLGVDFATPAIELDALVTLALGIAAAVERAAGRDHRLSGRDR